MNGDFSVRETVEKDDGRYIIFYTFAAYTSAGETDRGNINSNRRGAED